MREGGREGKKGTRGGRRGTEGNRIKIVFFDSQADATVDRL